jgi:homoserine dehydrogenase
MQHVRCLLVGLGNIGRRLCEVLSSKASHLDSRFGLRLRLVGAADSRGAAYDPLAGLHPQHVADLKSAGGSIADYPGAGRSGWRAEDLVAIADADVLLEALPVNYDLGAEPGLTCTRTALRRRIHVVTANKGPIVLAYRELDVLARASDVALKFDATVAGGLPALPIGQRDLRACVVERVEAVPNLVTGFVLDLLADGIGWEEALARARATGTLEGDGAWDLEGWDAAAKLVILTNAVLGHHCRIDDVSVTGITEIDRSALREARAAAACYRLIATAMRRPGGTYDLTVEPAQISPDHPLARLGPTGMGIVYHTDIYGTITALIDEPSPIPSAAAMLRDLLSIYCDVSR